MRKTFGAVQGRCLCSRAPLHIAHYVRIPLLRWHSHSWEEGAGVSRVVLDVFIKSHCWECRARVPLSCKLSPYTLFNVHTFFKHRQPPKRPFGELLKLKNYHLLPIATGGSRDDEWKIKCEKKRGISKTFRLPSEMATRDATEKDLFNFSSFHRGSLFRVGKKWVMRAINYTTRCRCAVNF